MPTTIAACLIVRDEAERLSTCLESLRGAVDELVLHDTGSTDTTVEIAREFQVNVIVGEWRDDFAQARNVALQAASARWILSVDADETVEVDAGVLRRVLADADESVDAFAVEISSGSGPDAWGLQAHQEVKLFRRGIAAYTGRVHEQLERPDGQPLRVQQLDPAVLRLRHSGYSEAAAAAEKAARNARLGRLEVHDLRADPTTNPQRLSRAELDLGRGLMGSGDLAGAVAELERVRTRPEQLEAWAWATDLLARIGLRANRPEEVLRLADELAATGLADQYPDWLRAQALGLLGQADECRRVLLTITSLHDLAGRELDLAPVRELMALAIANGAQPD
ncbi:Glycosyl transferase family 2 [Frankineae bacterium MT45]|nr:Glycosyl transferase family 2 [Frankineae bacterium MT45]